MVGFRRLLTAMALVAWSGGSLAAALPSGPIRDEDMMDTLSNASHPFHEYPDILQPRQDQGELRILPLGASIMSGVGASNGGAGLRKWLRMALRHDGYNVNMVGSRRTGHDLVDNDHEATSGSIIARPDDPNDRTPVIRDLLQNSLGYKPNIVIINGGTNNANRNLHVDRAYELMGHILSDIWNAPDMSGTCIILSTLLPTTHETGARTRTLINSQYRQLVRDNEGSRCIYLADMEPVGEGRDFLSVDGPYWDDDPKIHPNDEGHKRMAYVFYAAILRAIRSGRVPAPAPKSSEPSTGCDKTFGNGIYAGGLTQLGSGAHDGLYKHSSEYMPVELTIESHWDRNQWRFARLFSRDYDDLVGWFEHGENREHRFGVWKNSADGRGKFTKINDLIPDIHCIPRGLHFIDMNADGLDDIVCIDPDGNAYLSVNKGGGSGNNPPTFKRVSSTGLIKRSEGPQSRVRLADIDGDGRGDYGILNNDGTVRFWRNGWVNDIPEYWQDLGIRVRLPRPQGQGSIGTNLHSLRFEDLNGDGRDDWMWMDYYGRTWTYTNTRSCATGRLGDGLNVRWRIATAAGAVRRPSHYGMSDHAENQGDMRSRIHFARIYGTKPAFGNLGVQDYVWLDHEELPDNKHRFTMRVWKNKGSGGTKVVADGNKYCNMVGHASGAMDYVWTWSTGAMQLFPNANKKSIQPGEHFWDQSAHPIIWEPPHNMDRRDLHLADWDNDGDCDIIYADPNSGNIRVWRNDFPTHGRWDGAFTEISVPTVTCGQRRGIGLHDLAVRFADITGNGRADYLCIHKDGKVEGYVHGDDGTMTRYPQFKYADGKDRANLRWADVNGDGRDDMIWIDKFNGNGHVWYNGGPADPSEASGSVFWWHKIGSPVYQGSVAGACEHYPDLDGNGRADMHSIRGSWTNEAETWFNPSCGLDDNMGDGDDGTDNPHLPAQPGNPLDGPGPGDPGSEDPAGPDGNCRNLADGRDWRTKDCQDEYVRENTRYPISEQWNGLDVPGAWDSALEFIECRKANGFPANQFSNVLSDFFNGPHSMFCQSFVESGNGCIDLALQCHSVNRPAGYYLLNSLSRVYSINWNIYTSLTDVLVQNDIETLASDFGNTDSTSMDPSLSIILDIVVMGWGLVMGPTWNKIILPKITGTGNAGMVKDTVNDLVKNSATLAKDLYTEASKERANSELGLQNKIRGLMHIVAGSWRNATRQANHALFDGGSTSVNQLTNLMVDGSMLEVSAAQDLDAIDLTNRYIQTMNALMIPQTWYLSHNQFYPVIIKEDIDCTASPRLDWTSPFIHYMTQEAYDSRFCGDFTDNKSYWLVGPRDIWGSCASRGEGNEVSCDSWGLLPGMSKLKDNTYKVTHADIIQGSIRSYEHNGNRNGYKLDEMDAAFLDLANDHGIRSPGVFSIPICSMAEARSNWERVYELDVSTWPNFPCNE